MSVIVVTGWRHYHQAIQLPVDTVLVAHGGCSGADQRAAEWAIQHQVPTLVFPVGKNAAVPCPVTGIPIGNGNAHWGYGKSAGPIRNRWMLQVMKQYYPNVQLYAYHNSKYTYQSSGTAGCVAAAQQLDIPVTIHLQQ